VVTTILKYGIEIQGLSRTSYIKFQNFQGPIPFSRTFQVLEKWKKNFKDFQELSRPCGHPVSSRLGAHAFKIIKTIQTSKKRKKDK